MVGMWQQGAWTRWEQAVECKVTLANLWKAKPHRVKFLIQGVYNMLPNPSNLFTWGKVETPVRGMLEHPQLLPKSPSEGRYMTRS